MATERRQGVQEDTNNQGEQRDVHSNGLHPDQDPYEKHGEGKDREAVRRGDASQQTDHGPPDMKPATGDQLSQSDRHAKGERKGEP